MAVLQRAGYSRDKRLKQTDPSLSDSEAPRQPSLHCQLALGGTLAYTVSAYDSKRNEPRDVGLRCCHTPLKPVIMTSVQR